MRLRVRSRSRRNSRLTLATAFLVPLVIAVAIWVGVFQGSAPKTPVQTQNVPPRREVNTLTAVLNMEGASPTRSAEPSPTTKSQSLQRLPRARISPLLIYLPFGSPAGIYQVHLLSGDGTAESPLAKFAAATETKEGLTVLKLSPDLSTYSPGIYTISVLRDGAPLWSCQFRLS